MDFERLSRQERYDALTEMADMYYNQGKTQVEIADYFDTTRFKVAKLLQDAKNEQIVEIKINFSNERNKSMEQELIECLPLKKALVVNTAYSSYVDSRKQVGQVGASYLNKLLQPYSVLGITWGKTIQTVTSKLPQIAHNPVSAIQLTGHMELSTPGANSRNLVRTVSSNYFGNAYYLNTPLYLNNPDLKSQLMNEPDIYNTICKSRELSVVLTGIGGKSSLPLLNPAFRPYITPGDAAKAPLCSGSIYGYVLDENGQIADLELNKKLIAIPLENILQAPHRIAVAYGRHKTDIISKVIRSGFVNELITDTDTAYTLLNQ